MDKPETVRTASPARSVNECCSDLTCESGLKNNFFEGKRLTPDMFSIEQRYQVERRRLLNRAIHGWGVVYGYALQSVEAKHGRDGTRTLAVGEGLALDRCGRELFQAGKASLAIDDLIVLDAHGRRSDLENVIAAGGKGSGKYADVKQYERPPRCWLLSVHYAEQLAAPVRISDPCACDRHEWDHACETVRYSLREIDCDDCCDDVDCELKCGCATGPCCEEQPRREPGKEPMDDPRNRDDIRRRDTARFGEGYLIAPAGAPGSVAVGAAAGFETTDTEKLTDDQILDILGRTGRHARYKPFKRGGCRCLCDHLTTLKIGGDCDLSCEIEEPCARVRVDLEYGVPLACVQLVKDECDDWTFDDELVDCGPRRLVKRNDLLFDLVRGCDLTRIAATGWLTWHRRHVEFEEFTAAFGPKPKADDESAEYVTRDFWVVFTRLVRQETLRPDCFAITVLSLEREGGWWQPHRVPIHRLEFIRGERDPLDLVRGARIVVEGTWFRDGLYGSRSVFYDETQVEIEFRGDLVLDCNGQPPDVNLLGFSAMFAGNGTPGGTLFSSFSVGLKPPPPRPTPHDTYPTGAKS